MCIKALAMGTSILANESLLLMGLHNRCEAESHGSGRKGEARLEAVPAGTAGEGRATVTAPATAAC